MRHLFRLISWPRQIEHPLRTLLTILGIALGVSANISVQMIIDTMSDSFESMIDAVSGKVALQVSGGEAGVAEKVYDDLQTRDTEGRPPVAGVQAAMPTIQVVTKFGSENVLILAVDTLNDKAAREYNMTGADGSEISDPLTFLNSTNAILLNREFAAKHGVRIDGVIDLLTSAGRKPFVVRGLLEGKGPATAFGGNFALMDVYAAQQYFGRNGVFDSVDLLLSPGADVKKVQADVEAFLGGRYDVKRPEQRNEGVDSLLRNLNLGLTIMTLVVMAMGGFIIFNTVTTSVYQRIKEIGILRMVGVTRSGIWSLITIEGLYLGLAGSAVGIAGGYFLGRFTIMRYIGNVTSLFVPANPTHAVFTPEMIVKGVIMGLGVTLVGAIWPAYRATSITPLQVVRFGPGLSRGRGAALGRWTLLAAVSIAAVMLGLHLPALREKVAGIELAMLSVLVVGIAMTPLFMFFFLRALVRLTASLRAPLVRLAGENLLRDLGRSSMTVAAFMVALAVMFEIYLFMNSFRTEMRNWMDTVLKADVFVTSSDSFAKRTSMPMDPSMTEKIESIPGVKTTVEVRVRPEDYRGSRIILLGINFGKYMYESRLQFVDRYDPQAVDDLAHDKGVMLSQNLVRRNPWLKGAKTITLGTPYGKKDYRILGVIVDYTSETGAILLNRGLYIQDFGDPLVDTYHVYLNPGTDSATVRKAIDDLAGDNFNLFVLTNKEFKEAILTAIDQIFALAVSLEILTLIIAVIGIINNLLANVIDRTREIGVLRSLGATRAQIARVFFFQSAIMGLSGAIVATGAGWGLGTIHLTRLAMLLSGWKMPMHYSTPLIAATFCAAVATAALSGIFPAVKAAGLKLREALKYE